MKLPVENLRRISGIYCAIHRASLIIYVGSAINLWKRFNEHLSASKRGSKNLFHRALREFGPDAFDFEVLEKCPKEQLLERERFWIVFFNAASAMDGFNTRDNPVATYDHRPSKATLERMSIAKAGFSPSFEVKSKGGKTHKGKPKSPEQIEKMRQANLGRKASDKARLNMSIAQKNRTERHEVTQAIRDKISATLKAKNVTPPSRKGMTNSPEMRAKQSEALKGRTFSDSHKEALRVLALNRTPEQKAAAAEKMKVIWAKRKSAAAQGDNGQAKV